MSVKKEKSECCLECNLSFTDVIYRAKNLCNKCYNRLNRPPKPEYLSCQDCHIKWGDKNKKGKVIIKSTSKGLCKACYMKRYSSKIERICTVCNEIILNKTSRDVCKRCFSPTKKKSHLEKQEKNKKHQPTKQDYENLRKLLNRYKWGTYTSVDHFILIDMYMTIVCNEVYLSKYEGMNMEAQIIYMLKDLKEKYDKEKVYNKQGLVC